MGATTFSAMTYIMRYFTIMAAFLLAIGLEPIRNLVDLNGLYTRAIVRLTGCILSYWGLVEGIDGSIIKLKGIALNVLFGCNGLEAVFIYCAALMAYPTTWRERFIGILAGIAVIQALNIARIAALGLVAAFYPKLFPIFHIYIAQGLMIAVALVLFLWWLGRVSKKVQIHS